MSLLSGHGRRAVVPTLICLLVHHAVHEMSKICNFNCVGKCASHSSNSLRFSSEVAEVLSDLTSKDYPNRLAAPAKCRWSDQALTKISVELSEASPSSTASRDPEISQQKKEGSARLVDAELEQQLKMNTNSS